MASRVRPLSAGRGLRASGPRLPGPPLRATLRELLMILLVLAPLALGARLGYAALADALEPDPVAMPVPEKGTRTVKLPMVINIAVDESGSMAASDPENRRWADVAALGRWLEKYERPGDRVAVTRFTGGASGGQVVTPEKLAASPQLLAPAPPLDGTAFLPVAREAERIFGSARRAHFRILILITDGYASDAKHAIARLPAVANRVFVVALDRGRAWEAARGEWERGGFPVTRVENKSPNEIGAAMARAVMEATGEDEA